LDYRVSNIHDELIERCRNGDPWAFKRLYDLYSKAMFNTAFRITGNDDDAGDVLQEAFISAFHNLDRYRQDATFGSWLKRIVINKAINHIRKRRTVPLPENEESDIPDEPQIEIEADEDTVKRIREAIEQLPDGYRTVLTLYLLEGYDHQEISEIMGITVSTSKSQLNRAKAKLKEILMTRHETET
jgi:RNA polymerase sigma-70 factor (ECF subfamily)